MAKRDILKEAIADAKTVKETAIANAKAALEEAFTPRLKEMLATKLEEMDLDEEEEKLKEAPMKAEKTNKKGQPDMRDDKKGSEEYRTERAKEKMEEDLDEEIDLDEILAEIELDEEKKDIDEDEKTRAEEEGYLDGEEDADKDMEDKEDEEIDLEDMTDEDLKDFIEDVIADMVASGDLEAGENFEEEDEMEVVDDEEEVDVEISEAKKKKDEEDKKDKVKESMDVEEAAGNPISTSVKAGSKNKYDEDFKKAVKDDLANLMKKLGLKEDEINEDDVEEAATGTPTSTSYSKDNKYDVDFKKAVKDDLMKLMKKIGLKEEELDEAYTTIESLKSDLNEVNLLNAKLLYTNKIFKAKTLTESQKVKVLGAFDKAGTVKETKLVFETLSEGLKTKKKSPIVESLGSASRVSRSVNAKKPIVEIDPMVARFKKLAGLK